MSELTDSDMIEEMKLTEYAKWARQSSVCLGYKVQPWVVKKGGDTPRITDEEAVQLERALGMVREGHPRTFYVLMWHYVLGKPDAIIGEDLADVPGRQFGPLRPKRVQELRLAGLRAWFYCWQGMARQKQIA